MWQEYSSIYLPVYIYENVSRKIPRSWLLLVFSTLPDTTKLLPEMGVPVLFPPVCMVPLFTAFLKLSALYFGHSNGSEMVSYYYPNFCFSIKL